MALTMDPEIAAIVSRRPPAVDESGKSIDQIRAEADVRYTKMASRLVVSTPVAVTGLAATATDGASIPLRFYEPEGTQAGDGLVIYLHGGGMWRCSIDTHDNLVRFYAAGSAVKFLAVDYRMSPENPFPYSVEDNYSALLWAVEHAGELGIDPTRIAIAGDSAGGGMAAAVALMARDRGEVQLALQVLIYPMLDDRIEQEPELASLATWTYADNQSGWQALLGAAAGGPDVSPYAAPARAVELAGLAPAYVEVGSLDIFRDETVDYVARLVKAGVDTEFHLWNGAPHAFEMIGSRSTLAKRAFAERFRAFATLGAGAPTD